MRVATILCLLGLGCGTKDTPGRAADAGIGPAPTAPISDGGPSPADAAPPPSDARSPSTYTNPLLPNDLPDPFVLRDGATYYAFATNAGASNVPVVTSKDLASWTTLPDALPALPSWAKANASLTWAPSVLRRGSTYVLYYTARSKVAGFQCIGRAVAATPAGPYVDDTSAPFICQEALCGSIDASPFVASNGDAYLLWKSDENAAACASPSRLWSQRLGIDGLSLLDVPLELLARDRNWEAPLIEGPSMVEVDNRYYLFYSANWWESPDYGIGYAICSTPRGPCAKKTLDRPLVSSGSGALGPGGQEIFSDPQGQLWMSYHAWSAPIVGYANGGSRSLRIDRLDFPGGVPSLAGPTTSARPL